MMLFTDSKEESTLNFYRNAGYNSSDKTAYGLFPAKEEWLDEHNIEYTERHIAEDNPTYEELTMWYEQSELPLKKFFNTSGLIYKEMQLKDKLPLMNEDEQLKLLAANGMLVKRPMVISENRVLIGFKEAEWEELL